MRFVAVAIAATILGLWFVAREAGKDAPTPGLWLVTREVGSDAPRVVAVRRADLRALAQQVARVDRGEPALPAGEIDEVAADAVDPDAVDPDALADEPSEESDPHALDLSSYEAYGEVIMVVSHAPVIDTSTVTCGGPVIIDVEAAEPIPLPEPSGPEQPTD